MKRSARLIAALAAGLVALGAAGCKGNCRQLSEKLCACADNTAQENACLTRASTEESRIGPSPSDEEVCGQLLAAGACDCHNLATKDGKVACGLARP